MEKTPLDKLADSILREIAYALVAEKHAKRCAIVIRHPGKTRIPRPKKI